MSLLHIKESGWFPFCGLSKEPEHGPDTDYPVGVPLKKAMEWWWLVKYWEPIVTFNLSETSNNGKYAISYQPTSTVFNENNVGYDKETMKKQRDWVCGTSRSTFFSSQGQSVRNDRGQSDSEYSTEYSLPFSFQFKNSFWIDKNKIVWPEINVSGWLDTKYKSPNKVIQQLDPSAHFIVDNISIPVHVAWVPYWVEEDQWTASGITKVELKPVYF